MRKYNIIYADPPWQYKTYSKKGQGRSAENHYPTMELSQICDLSVKGRDNSLLMNQETRNKRDVWSVSTNAYRMKSHFAMFPEKLIEPCILAGSQPRDIVLDPFFGSGTTGAVAKRLGRKFIGIDLNREYCEAAEKRISEVA